MLDTAVALAAGAAVAVAVLAALAPRVPVDEVPGGPWLRRRWSRWWASEAALAQLAVAIVGAVVAASATGLIALALPGAIGSVAVVRLIVGRRAHAARIRRQDAVLESVRMLRQLLETGAAGVQQAIAVLAERGPEPLRQEFRLIAATSLGRRQAWFPHHGDAGIGEMPGLPHDRGHRRHLGAHHAHALRLGVVGQDGRDRHSGRHDQQQHDRADGEGPGAAPLPDLPQRHDRRQP